MAQGSEGEVAAATASAASNPASSPSSVSAPNPASTLVPTPSTRSSPFSHALCDKAEAALVAAGAAVEARAVVAAAEAAAAEAIAAAQAAVQHERALQLQAVRERRLARHRAKRLRRAIERMAQGDRVELYDLSFEEKTQVAVAGFVAVLLAAPLLALLPRAVRVTLLPAGALVALALMLLAEIRSGTEQPAQSSPPSPTPPIIAASSPTPTPVTPAPLRRPARAAIGPPYAIGGSRPKNVTGDASMTEIRARASSLSNGSNVLKTSLTSHVPDNQTDGEAEDPYGTLLSLQESDISLGISGSTYDITLKGTATDKSKSATQVGNSTYDFQSSNLLEDAQIPTWISEVSQGMSPLKGTENPYSNENPCDNSQNSPASLGDNAMTSCKSAFLSSDPMISACRMSIPPNGVLSPECGDPDVFTGGLPVEPRTSARAFGSLRIQESSPAALSGGATVSQASFSDAGPKD